MSENIVEIVKSSTKDLNQKYEEISTINDSIAAKKLLSDFIDRFIDILCSDDLSGDMKTVFFSEYSRPTEDFNILYDGLILPVNKMFASLLVLASNNKIESKDAYLFTFPIFSQLFVFGSRKETICKFMDWDAYHEEGRQKLKEYMKNQVNSLISSNV